MVSTMLGDRRWRYVGSGFGPVDPHRYLEEHAGRSWAAPGDAGTYRHVGKARHDLPTFAPKGVDPGGSGVSVSCRHYTKWAT